MLMAGLGIYFVVFVALLVAGVALAVRKLMRLKDFGSNAALKNDHVSAAVTELSTKRKTLLFMRSVPVIIMLLLTIDAFAGGFLASVIYNALR
jgi:hypothetical protein